MLKYIGIILSVILIVMNFGYLWFAESTRRKNEYDNIKNVFYRTILSFVLAILFIIQAILNGKIYDNMFFRIMMWMGVLIWIESLIFHVVILKRRIICISFTVIERANSENNENDKNE